MHKRKTEVLAIIPARSGSKTIRDKNIMSIGGKPLIAYSIEHALQSELITRVIVSTDSEYYAEISKEHGAEIPFLRPSEFAGDFSTDLEVFIHALEYLEKNENYKPEICVHFRPTCPIRDVADIDNMIRIIQENPSIDSVRSLSIAEETPFKMWSMSDNMEITPVVTCDIKEAYNMPRQKLPVVYIQNASIDVVRSSTITVKKSMTGDKISGYVMEHFYDIDTMEHFEKASNALMLKKGNFVNKKFCFDIDGVIATLTPGNDYSRAMPIEDNIKVINQLFDSGNIIILHTARGFITGIDWTDITKKQLEKWGVLYHQLYLGKPAADYYIDDRMISISDLKKIVEGFK